MTHTERMPGRNIIKQYAAESYYHIYTRGVNKQATFLGEADYAVFVGLLKRYLSEQPAKSASRHIYPTYRDRIELLAYALMPNHVHLFIYQRDERAISEFMRSLMTSYGMSFNRVHKRVGPVFQSRYRASLISDDAYLEHISRYIHLNPTDWRTSDKTSLDYYRGTRKSDWVRPKRVLDKFTSSEMYLKFVEDYEAQKQMLDELKWELANPDE